MASKPQCLTRPRPDQSTVDMQQNDSDSDAQQDDSASESEGHLSYSDSDNQQDDQESDQNFQEMTMEELLKLQEDMGTKAFSKTVLKTGGGIVSSSSSSAVRQKGSSVQLKRANKNRPVEVPMMRQAAPRLASLQPGQNMKRKITRDPRFDDLSGNLNVKAWQGNYSFLKEMRTKEKEMLKKELKKEQDSEKKQRMKSIVQRMENQEREHARKEKEREVKQLERQEQREALRQGKKPKFLTNKERKLMVKAAHFEDLKKGNKLDKYLERKEKRLKRKEMKNETNF